MKFIRLNIIIPISFLLFISCASSEYDQLVQQEATSETVLDSLVFDFHFGDTKKHFFDRCWKLNKKEVIQEGPSNKYVKYSLKPLNEKESPIQMLFYGIFDDKNILTGMDFRFSFNYWSTFSDEYAADKLVPQLKDTLMNWYPGNDFIPIKIKEINKDAYVKIDANRQILVYTKDSKDVVVKIEDLREKYPNIYK